MPPKSQNLPAQDTHKSQFFSTIGQAELSPLVNNILIAALVGVITFSIVSSLIVATHQNNLNQNNNLETKKTPLKTKFI
ncbi:MAG: hypothetical protein QNJ68_15000 [Microcoleaceae cyanobacterium MO_207.B10]|nr:hypothetical protein [Microcoleaceae cyanobacterium MO_207.B10]